MHITKADRPALVLIDIQKGFDNIEYWGGQRNNPDAEKNAADLLKQWRSIGLPVIHIRHCSTNQRSPLHETNAGNDFKLIVQPLHSETIVDKNVHCAFIGTGLEGMLDEMNIRRLVLVGLTTDQCVSTTTRVAANLGFETFLISDATATFCKKGIDGVHYSAELLHETALASLKDEFASILTTDEMRKAIG